MTPYNPIIFMRFYTVHTAKHKSLDEIVFVEAEIGFANLENSMNFVSEQNCVPVKNACSLEHSNGPFPPSPLYYDVYIQSLTSVASTGEQ